jgi:alpha-galactosidase
LYKELRHVLHGGDVVRVEHPDPGAWLHGVVSPDRREAVFCYTRLDTSPEAAPGRLHLPGLDPELEYDVRPRGDLGDGHGLFKRALPWWERGGTTARGAVLERIGLAAPALDPARAVVLHLLAR